MKAQFLAHTAPLALIATLTAGCSAAYGGDVNSAPETAALPGADAADYNPEIPTGTGYFAADSDLPFLAPDFTKISEDDYIPAFEQGMAIQQAEVQAIIDNPAAPDMGNTIVALEQSG
ncbi:MAG: dipeptidyl carboxypeptidase II, partial [Pseudomonadota bacterium]